jgi:hypothetical protein
MGSVSSNEKERKYLLEFITKYSIEGLSNTQIQGSVRYYRIRDIESCIYTYNSYDLKRYGILLTEVRLL